jgi:hypothetical protein
MIFTNHAQRKDGVITTFPSERIWFWTRTVQAFFSSRRALLIQWVVKRAFFRFGGIPDRLGLRSLGEWSGQWLALPALARRVAITLAAFVYLRWPDSLLRTPCYVENHPWLC